MNRDDSGAPGAQPKPLGAAAARAPTGAVSATPRPPAGRPSSGADRPLRVVVVDASAAQRLQLVEALQADGDIQVVGEASTAEAAVDVVASRRPEVVALDLDLPAGGGQVAVEHIMASNPTAILVLSVGGQESDAAARALVSGALLAQTKPAPGDQVEQARLRRSVRTLRHVPVIRHPRGRLAGTVRPPAATAPRRPPLVAMAASTGGPPALAAVLAGLGGLAAPVLVVQHLHADFVDGLVTWMARASALPVELARHGELPRPGHVYLGPGDVHLRIGALGRLELDPKPVTRHRPSADELFCSVAEHLGPAAVGVLMTGMGDDGARGLLALRTRGAKTLAQDEATSAVFGMPNAALRLGAVDRLVPLDGLATAILRSVREPLR